MLGTYALSGMGTCSLSQVELGQWNSYLSALSPAAREKLIASCQL